MARGELVVRKVLAPIFPPTLSYLPAAIEEAYIYLDPVQRAIKLNKDYYLVTEGSHH